MTSIAYEAERAGALAWYKEGVVHLSLCLHGWRLHTFGSRVACVDVVVKLVCVEGVWICMQRRVRV